ncbi:MAG TPA: hypothetical protein VN327_13475 [Pseudonocardiaceae bacterium]|nr:hypothetical protein [Pseudonocardiaceae bacterium]
MLGPGGAVLNVIELKLGEELLGYVATGTESRRLAGRRILRREVSPGHDRRSPHYPRAHHRGRLATGDAENPSLARRTTPTSACQLTTRKETAMLTDQTRCFLGRARTPVPCRWQATRKRSRHK